MGDSRALPADPVAFIETCLSRGDVYWTHHVHMRLSQRSIRTSDIQSAIGTFELIEAYPDDKYLPSYLVLGQSASGAIHALFGADVTGENIRVITAYHPDPGEWSSDMKTRRRTP